MLDEKTRKEILAILAETKQELAYLHQDLKIIKLQVQDKKKKRKRIIRHPKKK